MEDLKQILTQINSTFISIRDEIKSLKEEIKGVKNSGNEINNTLNTLKDEIQLIQSKIPNNNILYNNNINLNKRTSISETYKPEIEAIFCDLDGTLLNNNHQVSKENIEAIKECRKKNVRFIINSGRSYPQIENILKQIGTYEKENEYSICMNGAVILENKHKKIIRQIYMRMNLVKKIIEISLKYNLMIIIYTYDFIYIYKDNGIDSTEENQSTKNFKVYNNIDIDNIENEVDGNILKITLVNRNDFNELNNAYNELKKNYGKELSLHFTFNNYYLEINKNGCNKALALKWMCDYLQLNEKNTIAIGDSPNDYEVLEEAGIGAAMNNADAKSKRLGNYITKTDNNNSGVAEVLNSFVLNKNKISAVFCNVDSFVNKENNDISIRNKICIAGIIDRGIKFIINTGKNYMQIENTLKQLKTIDKEEEYSIILNGAVIFENKNKKILKQYNMDKNKVNEIINYIDNFNKDINITCEIYGIDKIYIYKDDGIESKNLKKNYNNENNNFVFLLEKLDNINNIKEDIIKIVFSYTKDINILKNIEKNLKEKYNDIIEPTQYDHYLEINGKNIDKGNAMKWLCDYLKINIKQTIAIGNKRNDYKMLDLAGIGTTVSNASENSKKLSNYISRNTNDRSGVAEVLEKFILNSKVEYEFDN